MKLIYLFSEVATVNEINKINVNVFEKLFIKFKLML